LLDAAREGLLKSQVRSEEFAEDDLNSRAWQLALCSDSAGRANTTSPHTEAAYRGGDADA
jgi:hypothetical protein